MEPQLSARYSDYLAEYLRSGFSVRQIGNTYNTISNALEQMMTLLILFPWLSRRTESDGKTWSVPYYFATTTC